jgi:large subunit ribosomal protein L13
MGRLASEAARLLTGKNRADYSKDVDMGASVVIINAAKPVLTGRKSEFKVYFRHSGRPGGLKGRTFPEQMAVDPSKTYLSSHQTHATQESSARYSRK